MNHREFAPEWNDWQRLSQVLCFAYFVVHNPASRNRYTFRYISFSFLTTNTGFLDHCLVSRRCGPFPLSRSSPKTGQKNAWIGLCSKANKTKCKEHAQPTTINVSPQRHDSPRYAPGAAGGRREGD